MTTIAISGEMSTLSAIKEQKINQNLVIEEVEGYAVPSDETIAALKSSESVGVFKSFDEFEKSLENVLVTRTLLFFKAYFMKVFG